MDPLVDPHDGLPRPAPPMDDEAALERALSVAAAAAKELAEFTVARRAERVAAVAPLLRRDRQRLAELMVREVGKPVRQALAEVDKCAWLCEHVGSVGPQQLADEVVASDGDSFVRYEPLGVILAIMPWNYPLWQVFRFAAPALVAGNVPLVKHAPNVPACAEAIAELFAEAGLPAGTGASVRLPDALTALAMADRRVAAVTLTGSTRAGRAVAALAGAHLKPCVLELGGSDPFVVLSDADVDRAAATAVPARLQNNGQSCIAAKRFVVVASVAERFVARLHEGLSAAVAGDPADPATELGPLAREDLRAALHAQVVASVARGARCLLGGVVPLGPGFHYPATLLLGCGPGMPVWDEETFGPVAAVRVVADDDAAIEAAAHPSYGLGASVWTRSERASALASSFRAGAVFFNGMTRSDPRLPFGGVMDSGWGRELGVAGIRAFTNVKAVWAPLTR